MSPKSDRLVARPCRLVSGALGLLLLAATAVAAPPAWLLEDAKIPPLPAKETIPAEVLRDEMIVTIGPKGEWTETQRYAVRVRLPGGESAANMRVFYVEKSDKISAATAWLVTADKKRPRTYSRSEWHDVAHMNQTTLYTDSRWFGHQRAEAQVGDVYGGEVTVVRRHNAGQTYASLGGRLPLRLGRIEFRVPPGWQPDLFWLQGEGPRPTISADRAGWKWELKNLPGVKAELWAPDSAGQHVAAVIVRPPASLPDVYPRLKTWGDCARWEASVTNPQCNTSPEIKAMVAKLTAGMTEPWAKIEALTKYAQKQTYIQQYNNEGLGFGSRPRLASEVLVSGYGDCKDKANLLRALLREAGYQSYHSVVRVSPGSSVNPDFAVDQFNHAIVAIALPVEIEHPAVVTHPLFGRLLFFDPTNPWVPLGQLPWYEHGGYALICDLQETALTTMPSFPPEQAWGTVTRLDLEFIERGMLQGRVTETTSGEPAAQARARAHEMAPADKKKLWTTRLTRALRGVRVNDPVEKETGDGRYLNEVEFVVREFGQLVQDKLLVVRLDVLSRDTIPTFPKVRRMQPIVVRPVHDAQEVRLALPARGEVTELPAAKSLRSEFGEYADSYTMETDTLVYRRTLTLRGGTIPAEAYPALSAFLADVAKAEATSVVITLRPAQVAAGP
jgi:hypothetical protein